MGSEPLKCWHWGNCYKVISSFTARHANTFDWQILNLWCGWAIDNSTHLEHFVLPAVPIGFKTSCEMSSLNFYFHSTEILLLSISQIEQFWVKITVKINAKLSNYLWIWVWSWNPGRGCVWLEGEWPGKCSVNGIYSVGTYSRTVDAVAMDTRWNKGVKDLKCLSNDIFFHFSLETASH